MEGHGPILVPLDGSETAEGALSCAATLAEALRTHMVLITAWEGVDSELGSRRPALMLEVDANARDHYTAYLHGVRERMKDPSVRTIVRSGDAVDEILSAATETGARMIVMATHGRSGLSRWLYGSTAARLLRESHLPLVAVGPGALRPTIERRPLRRVAVALDGSRIAEQAVPAARAIAEAAGAELMLIECVGWAVQQYPYGLPAALAPELDDELEAAARTYLLEQRELLAPMAAQAFVVRGSTADGLIEFVDQQEIDLVVMTTHAREGAARAVLGSTADRMLQGAAPVLLIVAATGEGDAAHAGKG